MEQVRSGQVSKPSGARRLPSRGSVPVRLASGAPRSKNSPHPLQCTTSRVDSQKHTGTTQVGWLYCHTRASVEPKRLETHHDPLQRCRQPSGSLCRVVVVMRKATGCACRSGTATVSRAYRQGSSHMATVPVP